MNCCNHNNNNNNRNSNGHGHGVHNHLGHMWMMLLCCGLPVIVLAVISLLGTGFPGVRTALYGILPFLCPVMMIAMLPMMFIRGKNNGRDQRGTDDQHCSGGTGQDDGYLK